jgi:hypothetical protein
MPKQPSPLQKVSSEKLVIDTVRVPWKGGAHLSFELTQPLVLKQGDSWSVEDCQAKKMSTAPVLDDQGEPATLPSGEPLTATQIDTVEIKFAVRRAGHRKVKTQWRYGKLQVASPALPPQ